MSDVDLQSGPPMIRRVVSDLPGRVEVRSTKTGLIRRLALDAATGAVMEAQRGLATESCTAVGVILSPEAYVWSQAPGYSEPKGPGRITSWFAEPVRGFSDWIDPRNSCAARA
jgi:integrase